MERIARRIAPWLLAIAAAIATLPAAAAPCAAATPGQTVAMPVSESGRTVLLHLPAGFDPSRPAPLLLLFHGSGGSGRAALDQSRLTETADAHGFILVAPDGGIPVGKGFVWNIPGVPAVGGRMPQPGDADDIAFVKRIVDWLAAQRCVDPARVYATGISGGGRMTSWLACVDAGRFAAIAPVVGLRAGNPSRRDPQTPDPATCRPKRPMPVIAFAGDADTTNPIQGGGAGYWQYPMRAAEARWAALNHCRATLPIRQVEARVYEEGYGDCRGGAEVIARITQGGRHVWLADNEAMWTFLSRHRRN